MNNSLEAAEEWLRSQEEDEIPKTQVEVANEFGIREVTVRVWVKRIRDDSS